MRLAPSEVLQKQVETVRLGLDERAEKQQLAQEEALMKHKVEASMAALMRKARDLCERDFLAMVECNRLYLYHYRWIFNLLS